ncbi:alpha-galactosidase [Vallitalea okinawensis]|uniref:alpha-galactosidase n=1 Tax=Vallitalea okinawensis TaxID=2078660 RepID=UPI000CFD13EA|nr:alpha-galactosidase [Vallitalea okinawensis]
MAIIINENNKLFHLQTKNTSYIMQIYKKSYLSHVYWGKKIHSPEGDNLAFQYAGNGSVPRPDLEDKTYTLASLAQEYSAYGTSDYRYPAFQVQHKDGSTICDVRVEGYKIHQGKPEIKDMPSTYVETGDKVETLEIILKDELKSFKVSLYYAVYEDYDVITRWAVLHNEGDDEVKVLRALSTQVDFSDNDYEMLYLNGSWGRERHVVREKVNRNIHMIDSKLGGSGHVYNPFIAVMRPTTDEFKGDVYGFNLVYSGNFIAGTEVEQFGSMRVTMGINPFDFSWLLEAGEAFTTPEAVMVYSSEGLNGMSKCFHKIYRERLCRGQFRDAERPILINNWEATYFDFDHNKLVDIATEASKLGIELFVLDDGWFGNRNDDHRALGDWFVNRNKLPGGIQGVADAINELGMQFGLWVEPEMVNPDSELYREHPDWCIHLEGRSRTEGRHQLILDLSREDVCDYLINILTDVFSSGNIGYVKWDMNRFMTEIGSALLPPDRQREVPHRYILGLYRVMDTLTKKFPHILFEGCASGGGRMDPGILYYMPQFWTSDNTDAIERLYIQYGTSMVYPQSTMGAHVSECPNHQVERTTPLKTRADVAMSANFGYELDATKMTDIEKAEVKEQVEWYKKQRSLIQYGDFYRLVSPFEGEDAAWMIVSQDKKECLVYYYQKLSQANSASKDIKLAGLADDMVYMDYETGSKYYGDQLMNLGVRIPNLKDFGSKIIHFKAE